MSSLQVALYARMSSEQQAEAGTIESQVAALRERIAQDGQQVAEDQVFLDDGYSGSTLVRPALEQLRDRVAVEGLDDVQRILPATTPARQSHQHSAIVWGDRGTSGLLPLEHDHLLTQKVIFSDQLLLTSEQIRGDAQNGLIGGGLGPALQLHLDALKTLDSQMFTCAPDGMPAHRICLFHAVEERDDRAFIGEDYTQFKQGITPDSESSRHRVQHQNPCPGRWERPLHHVRLDPRTTA